MAGKALYILCAALLVGEAVIHRHSYFALEAMPLFFVGFGFFGLVLLLLGGHGLAALVSRRADYFAAEPHESEGDGDV
jgi:hypothetical protein